jgi:hypothetical protein
MIVMVTTTHAPPSAKTQQISEKGVRDSSVRIREASHEVPVYLPKHLR